MNKTFKAIVAAASFAFASHAIAAGAIVVDEQDGPAPTYAFVSVKGSHQEAASTALAQCRADGGDSCLVAVRFEQCAALADSSKRYRVGLGATIAEASKAALKDCPGCTVVQAACDGTRMASR